MEDNKTIFPDTSNHATRERRLCCAAS
jgi:hypothetical protein